MCFYCVVNVDTPQSLVERQKIKVENCMYVCFYCVVYVDTKNKSVCTSPQSLADGWWR